MQIFDIVGIILFAITAMYAHIKLPAWILIALIGMSLAKVALRKVKKDYYVIEVLFGLALIALVQHSNREHIIFGLALGAMGILSNGMVHITNGRMPVADELLPHDCTFHMKMEKFGPRKTRFNLLGDWIPIMGSLNSPGDILIDLGFYVAAIQWFFFWRV